MTDQSEAISIGIQMKYSLRLSAILLTAWLLVDFHVRNDAAAHDGATGVVLERMESMKSLGGAMKALAGIIRGRSPYEADKVEEQAKIIKSQASTVLLKLFPKGSDGDPSVARAEIWTEWETFSKLADELSLAATSLQTDAKSESLTKATFAKLAKICRDCHQQFRQKR